ncbi:MAG TPA: hypothetical protein VF465_05195, partial [Flavobacterium sp.]|uniref:hypothetical protein n=1 Tax=Flavobacterium sp. TaxID=239 RepID=UPI002ED518CE
IISGDLETQSNEVIQFPANTNFDGIRTYISDKLHPGMTIKDSDGNVVATILEVNKNQGSREFVSNGSLVKVPDPERVKVHLKMEIKTKKINGQFLFREENRILIGRPLQFDFSDFTIAMTVSEIQ